MITVQRRAILLIALILLHLAGFSQEKKYVKKNLAWQPLSGLSASKKTAPSTPPAPTPSPYLLMSTMPAGFFCRQEYKLEKKTGIPIKFRLGTYELAHRQEYGR